LIFLAEYAGILFMRLLFCIIFLGSDLYSFLFYVKLAFIYFLYIWVRDTMPRFRYDKLIYLAWKRFNSPYLVFFCGIVASSWLIYLKCVMMHGLANFEFWTLDSMDHHILT
jgi:NADH-ubiquinone oxidoreductase chain 1